MSFTRLHLLLAGLSIGGAPALADGVVVPTIKAETLNKTAFTVPASFTATRNILLFSFGRDMQAAVDGWDAALADVRSDSGVETVQVYNMPLIPNPGGIVRGFISGGMRGIYKVAAMRDRVIVLYVDEAKVMPALGVTDRSAPLVLVTDKDGHEIGRVQGVVSGERVAQVRALASR